MTREVPEWKGANDNTSIPARVKVRIFDRCNGKCVDCGNPIRGSLLPAYDHILAICNGGQNAESNLQLLCEPCHAKKTKRDVAEKSVSYRKKLKAIGIKKPRTMTRWRKFNGEIVHATRER